MARAIALGRYFKVCMLAERSNVRLRPLGKDEATNLEIRGAIVQRALQHEYKSSHSDPSLSGVESELAMAIGVSPRSRVVIS